VSVSSTFGLKADGSVWGWGDNGYGQLGDLSVTQRSSPVSVTGTGQGKIVIKDIAASVAQSFGLDVNGKVWAWGRGFGGALGQRTNVTDYSSPVSVVGAHSFIKIVGHSHGAAGLKITGDVWGWGFNSQGHLGQQNTVSYSSPVMVVGSHSFTNLFASPGVMMGLKSDGSAWAWGINSNSGNLGDQTKTDRSSPVSVVGGHAFLTLCVGSGGSANVYNPTVLGIKRDGTCWAWGEGSGGTCGDLTTDDKSSPVSVVGGHLFNAVAFNGASAKGVKSDGSLWYWGQHPNQGTNAARSSPVAITAQGVMPTLGLKWDYEGMNVFGAAVASADTIITTGQIFHVTGTTGITNIYPQNFFFKGQTITMIFDDAVTVTDGGNLKIAGDFTSSADDTLSLRWDGNYWYETGRSVN
jgi:alpha-tubulin suppressor-like RCC1 family protein